MYIKEAHILIDQGLQNIGVLAYSDIDIDEVDLALKTTIWEMMDADFPNKNQEETTKPKLDKYALLLEKENIITGTLVDGRYENVLPENYFHIVKLKTIALYECGRKHTKSGDLQEGEWYQNIGDIAITYNNVLIPIRGIFKVEPNIKVYTSAIGKKPYINKLKRIAGQTRFKDEEFITIDENTGLSKPIPKSPLSTRAGKKIFTSVDNFFIEKFYISYLKKPNTPNYRFKEYTNVDALTVGTEYEVIEGTVIYNGVSYTANNFDFKSFTAVTGITAFTGTGVLRVKDDGDILLPYQVCLDIVRRTVLNLAVKSEQPQGKINNLASLDKV